MSAGERLAIAVSPLQFAPTNVKVRIHMAPDDANRALELIAERVLSSAGGD